VAACVLIVDDEETVCSVASKMLERWGYRTMVSYDGVAAVDLYRESWQKINLVVLDMAMPKMGGRETFYALREINPDVAVLLTSGYSINDEVQELLEAGANGFIQKPFWKNEFSRVVAESLPRRAGDSVPDERR
jgi:CheY-like chemotaxis protein